MKPQYRYSCALQQNYSKSAGFRVLLACQKMMNVSGSKIVVINPNEMIMDIF